MRPYFFLTIFIFSAADVLPFSYRRVVVAAVAVAFSVSSRSAAAFARSSSIFLISGIISLTSSIVLNPTNASSLYTRAGSSVGLMPFNPRLHFGVTGESGVNSDRFRRVAQQVFGKTTFPRASAPYHQMNLTHVHSSVRKFASIGILFRMA